jgi:serine phosphatase RsbU (regulator of sigma subunit)/DNA-binding response OmpR family regulator
MNTLINTPRIVKVLAVDDDALIRKVLGDIFGETYLFKAVGSAQTFMNELFVFNPDVVLVDVILPDGNGIDLCSKIRLNDDFKNIHIIILTSFEDSKSIEAAYSAGANDYIRKPFIPFEIISKLNYISKSLEYQENVIDLYNQQKKSNQRLLRLTEMTRKSIHSSDKEELLLSAFSFADIVHASFCEVVVFPGETIEFKKKLFSENFNPVSYTRLATKHPFFIGDEKQIDSASISRSDGTNISCLMGKIIYNKVHVGYIILQKDSPFAEGSKQLISLYLDFININGSEIESRQFLVAEVKKERKELSKVRSLQALLLPDFREIERYDIASTFIPMDEISGDFFDAFYINDSTYQIILCDVAGHGMASSYIGSSIRSLIRSVDNTELSTSQIIEELNDSVVKNLSNTYYFSSLILCSLNLDTDEIAIVSAGHPPCFYYDAEHRQYEKIEKTGPLIGLISGSKYDEHKITIKNGDCLFLYTDGVTEAQTHAGSDLYGENRLFSLFQDLTDLPSIEIVHAVVGSVYEYTGYESLNDDVTAICIKKKS